MTALAGHIGLLSHAAPRLARRVFDVPATSKIVFYLLAVIASVCFMAGVLKWVRRWRLGRKTGELPTPRERLGRLISEVLLQRRVFGRGAISAAHVLLFSGFVILFIATILVAIEHWAADLLGREPTDPVFHKGLYYAIYEITTDAFGLAFVIGCGMFLFRRAQRPASLGHVPLDWLVLALLFVIGITGYFVEGARIIQEHSELAGVSFVGLAVSQLLVAGGLTADGAAATHLVVWWLHAVLALGLIAVFPYTRLRHVIAGVSNIATNTDRLGVMRPVSIEEVEATGKVGAGSIADLSRQQMVELDACVECGRCEEACPAFEAGRPLSPRLVVQDVRTHLDANVRALAAIRRAGEDNGDEADDFPSLHGDVIAAETLWSCTTCSACIDVCPLRVNPLGLITDMRRYLIAEGELRGPPATALQKTQRSGNPWGLPAQERFDWADGLDVPTVDDTPDFEVLYWVGCAAAYDRRVRRVARAMVRLLQHAGVRFAVLGKKERCTGESARRMGDEFVFQELAATNIATLDEHNVRKIVTHCPHCLNSLRSDYPQFGGNYEVVHHSEFLAELIAAGRLGSGPAMDGSSRILFHDPCYLARVAGVDEPPREVLQAAMGTNEQAPHNALRIIEPPRNRRQTACCGAGGGRMWFDDVPEERIGRERIWELLDGDPTTVAVACPFCLIMVGDGVAAEDSDVAVKDIAEVLADELFRET